jgi:RimJ/RimL family protein N-acetyltransferase
MIYELSQTIHKMPPNSPFPEARSIIEGNNPGWVFGNHPEQPSVALVWAQGIQGFYLVGDAQASAFCQELNRFVDETIAPRLHEVGIDWVEVSGAAGWNTVIEEIFRERELEGSQQLVYTLNPAQAETREQPDTTAPAIQEIDSRLLSSLSAKSRKFLLPKLEQFWGSTHKFLANGLGVVLMDAGEIASLCFSGFVAGDTYVVDIETAQAYRQKGYAEKTAHAFIAACAQRQAQVHWDCMAENIPSARLAEKLGFTLSHSYTLYSFPLNP